MVKSIKFVQYRKFKDMTISFDAGINAIAGINGTCKSTLLYLISNSFQEVNQKDARLSNDKVIPLIKKINACVNPKIESLTKGDRTYNNPAPGVSGTLFTVSYANQKEVNFRRHNTRAVANQQKRFAIKPYYKGKKRESLPAIPVIYLGLSRLLPVGEVADDMSKSLPGHLPQEYADEFTTLFKRFVNHDVKLEKPSSVAGIKRRFEFATDVECIDSNTVSAGEDNVSVILAALVSLHFYFDALLSRDTINAILLIDELDSTLHPTFQRKLLDVLRSYSKRFGIQVVFTTQSPSVLDYMLERKERIVYLLGGNRGITVMDQMDRYSLHAQLSGRSCDEIFGACKIPVFVEDDEAKWMLEILLDAVSRRDPLFANVYRCFYVYSSQLGADSLRRMMKDIVLTPTLKGVICILDGDHANEKTMGFDYRTTTLPIHQEPASPEKMLFDYAKELLLDETNGFWSTQYVFDQGFSPEYFRDTIQNRIDEVEAGIQARHDADKTAKGVRRAQYKSIFNDYKPFFECVFRYWLSSDKGQRETKDFMERLHILFLKVCENNDIPRNKWEYKN